MKHRKRLKRMDARLDDLFNQLDVISLDMGVIARMIAPMVRNMRLGPVDLSKETNEAFDRIAKRPLMPRDDTAA